MSFASNGEIWSLAGTPKPFHSRAPCIKPLTQVCSGQLTLWHLDPDPRHIIKTVLTYCKCIVNRLMFFIWRIWEWSLALSSSWISYISIISSWNSLRRTTLPVSSALRMCLFQTRPLRLPTSAQYNLKTNCQLWEPRPKQWKPNTCVVPHTMTCFALRETLTG